MAAEQPLHTAARVLSLAGAWDDALVVLGQGRDEATAVLAAEILVDRHWWRLDDAAPAETAVDRLRADGPWSAYLRARLAYQRLLFDDDQRPDDATTAQAGFRVLVDGHDEGLRAWGMFWQGVFADNVAGQPALAREWYQKAHDACIREGDLLLESYVIRHMAAHAVQDNPGRAEMLLRRSLQLRAAQGARPLVAAAQATLGVMLPDGEERSLLTGVARRTAEDLRLTWLLRSLSRL